MKVEKYSILIVDDAPDNIWFLNESLKEDYNILYATNGQEALEIARSIPKPDLVLLDIIMPGMDGFEVCKKLKADPATEEIAVAFLTSKSLEEDETKGFELGAQDYITKPFSITVVKARIKSILNLKKELQRRLELKDQMQELNRQLESQVEHRLDELEKAQKTLQSYEERVQSYFRATQKEREIVKILIVDDIADNIFILSDNLSEKYEILYATSGQDALRTAFSDDPPDLILLDIMMPEMDGYEVCARLKADMRTRDIPVIFVTAMGEDIDQIKGLEYGAVDYISKPFSMPVVYARIQAALRLKQEMDKRLSLTRELEEMNQELEHRVRRRVKELRKAKEDLALTEERYRSIFENAIEGVFQSTPDGRFLSANPAFIALLGYDSVSDLLESVTDIRRQLYVRPEGRDPFLKTLEEKGEIQDYEAEFRRKNGKTIWLSVSARLIADSDDFPTYLQGFVVDITRRRQAEDKLAAMNRKLEKLVEQRTYELSEKTKELELANIVLQRQDEMKSELVNSVSHDLRTPLTSMLGFAKLISKDFVNIYLPLSKGKEMLEKKGKRIQSNLEIISQEGERLTRLINDFLDVAKIEEGRIEWHDQEVNLKELFGRSVDAVQGEFSQKTDVVLTTEVGKGVPTLWLDSDRMAQVLINLLNNAAKFTERGSVRMTAEQESNGSVVIKVTDTGKGIPSDKLEQIFEKFHQIRNGDTVDEGPRGSGLGLVICRNILSHYEGHIWAESEVGKGSTFFVRLPPLCRDLYIR